MALALLMCALAMPWVAHKNFQLFYISHIVLATVLGLLPLAHGVGQKLWNGLVPIFVPGILLWIADLIVRFFAMNGARCPHGCVLAHSLRLAVTCMLLSSICVRRNP